MTFTDHLPGLEANRGHQREVWIPEQSSVWEALSLASLCCPPIDKDVLSSYFVPSCYGAAC